MSNTLLKLQPIVDAMTSDERDMLMDYMTQLERDKLVAMLNQRNHEMETGTDLSIPLDEFLESLKAIKS